MKWDDKTKNAIFRLRRKGVGAEVIADHLTGVHGAPVSAAEVEGFWQEMLVTGWVKRKRDAEKRNGVGLVGQDPALERHRMREASILHLVDLKRAGHSPTRTEYVIGSEGAGVRFKTVDTCSYLGSAAGLCAEMI